MTSGECLLKIFAHKKKKKKKKNPDLVKQRYYCGEIWLLPTTF